MDLSASSAGPSVLSPNPSLLLRQQTTPKAASFEDHPLFNARRLAEYVKAQHLVQQQRENETTPPSDEKAAKKRNYEVQDLTHDKDEIIAHSPENKSSSSSTGREVKKRRLDALLNKKFSMLDSPPSEDLEDKIEMTQSHLPTALPIMERRSSNERKANKRKQGLTLRSSAELMIPDNKNLSSPLAVSVPESVEMNKKMKKNEDRKKKKQMAEDVLKRQLLQLQLAQAALLTNSTPDFINVSSSTDLLKNALFASAANSSSDLIKSTLFSSSPSPPPPSNPLLYYGYYAQMLQEFQSQQQKKLIDQLVQNKKGKNEVEQNKSFEEKSSKNSSGFKLPVSPHRHQQQLKEEKSEVII